MGDWRTQPNYNKYKRNKKSGKKYKNNYLPDNTRGNIFWISRELTYLNEKVAAS